MTLPLLPTDPPVVGPFRVLGRLGAGGMGQVYLAEDPAGRQVAVKVIRPEYTQDPAYRRRFAREASAAARVTGPGVARVLSADPDGPVPYLVTEYVPGPTLAEHVQRSGPLHGTGLEGFAAGVAAGLAAVHAAGVVHRDLKPANVVLGPGGPRILDFGIARPADAATRHTATGLLVGSIGWMAPEVLRQQPATAAADVFAWGALVAYAGTGRSPFGDGPDLAVAHRVLAGPAVDLTGLPPRLAALAAAALAPDPSARPPAAGLAASLGAPAPTAALAPGVPPTRRAPAPPAALVAAPGWRRPRRWPWLLAGAAGALALVAALAPRPTTAGRPGATGASPTVRATVRPTVRPTIRATPRPSRSTPPPAPSPAPAGILVAAELAPVQDAGMLFRVTELRCGLTTIGSGPSADDLPDGEEACTALVTVRNVSGRPHAAGVGYLRDRAGRTYGSNGFLTRAMDRDALELHLLQPGEQLDSAFVWQVAPGFRPVEIVVHGDLVTLGARRRIR